MLKNENVEKMKKCKNVWLTFGRRLDNPTSRVGHLFAQTASDDAKRSQAYKSRLFSPNRGRILAKSADLLPKCIIRNRGHQTASFVETMSNGHHWML